VWDLSEAFGPPGQTGSPGWKGQILFFSHPDEISDRSSFVTLKRQMIFAVEAFDWTEKLVFYFEAPDEKFHLPIGG
jgi:hypothetical protein